jgi:hypothetical protein
VVERTNSWHNRFRKLHVRYEKKSENYLLVQLACCMISIVGYYWDRLLITNSRLFRIVFPIHVLFIVLLVYGIGINTLFYLDEQLANPPIVRCFSVYTLRGLGISCSLHSNNQ